jgi:hypothetical protein
MKHPYSEEILSAYVDGELTDQERAEVEHWLESSPGARERLEDFRGLSRLFATLPRTEVPEEFPAKVLQLAERRMLLPEAGASSTKRRRWILGISGSLASAAVLLICLQLQFRDPVRGNPGGRNLPLPGAASRAPRNSADDGPTDHEGTFLAAKTAGELQSTLASQQAGESAKGAGGQAEAEGAGGSSPPLVASRSKTESLKSTGLGGGGASREETRAYPQLVQINQAIDEIRQSGDDGKLLAVVKMRVVDRANGMMLLQRILAENNIVADDSDAVLEKNGTAAKRSAAKSGGNEALYVVAEPEQFIASFRAILDREDTPVRLSVESPLEIAALNPESQQLLNELNRPFLHSSLRQPERAISIGGDKDTEPPKKAKLTSDASAPDTAKADRSTPPLPAPPAPVDKNSEKKPRETSQSRNLSQGKEIPESNKGGAKEKEIAAQNSKQSAAGAARQFIVRVPKELEQGHSRAVAPARRTAPGAPAGDIPAPPAPRGERPDETSADGKNRGDGKQAQRAPALVQVLIVIELESATPAAQPTAGKAPPGGGA